MADMDNALKPIADKVYAGERLSREDGLTLLQSRDIWTIGELANHVRHQLHGNRAYYNINRHLNYSNICALSCKFCAFHRKKGDEGAYEYNIEQIVEQAQAATEAGATEMHMVGGLHPWLKFDWYTRMLSSVREACPKLHLKAFTAVEIVHLARIGKRAKDIYGVLKDLRDAGLCSLPGGGAEVFDDRVHDEVFKGKIRSDQWLDVHRAAHRACHHVQRHHALWPHRNARRPRASLVPAARSAGRGDRAGIRRPLPDAHPPAVHPR